MNKVVLEFCNIGFGYDKPLFNNISFKLHSNEILTILGGSGKGKTTLLKLANRLIDPTKGKIFYLSKNINIISPLKLRKEVCYIPQIPYMTEGTVKDNILLPFIKDKSYNLDNIVNSLLFKVGLDNSYSHRIANELSVGEQQRIAICRTMLNKCKILLLDEPSSALDYNNTLIIVKTLKDFIDKKHISIIAVTHKLSFAKLLDGRNLILKNNGISEVSNLDYNLLY